MSIAIERFALRVSDLERSVRFYRDVLGLEYVQTVEMPECTEVILGGEGGCQILLAKFKDQAGPVQRGEGFWKMYLQTDEIDALFRRAVAGGGTAVSAPQALPDYKVTVAFVLDPDGYDLELIQNDPS